MRFRCVRMRAMVLETAFRQVGRLVCCGAIGLLSAGSVVADDSAAPEKSPAAGREEGMPAEVAALAEAYARQRGYLATYRSTGEGKSLECTLGLDFPSGLGVVSGVATKGAERFDIRFWNTADDRAYGGTGSSRFVLKGMNTELQDILKLGSLFAPADEPGKRQNLLFVPSLVLESSMIGAGFGIATSPSPPWKSLVKDAKVGAADDTSVTFLTADHGELTIRRDNGMLVRQSIAGEDGQPRVLELTGIKADPGRDAILGLSADWSADGAEDKAVLAWMAPVRLTVFQAIIDFAEQGHLDQAAFEARLEDEFLLLRRFARISASQSTGPFATKIDWRKAFAAIKEESRRNWLAENSGASFGDDSAFLEDLRKPERRLEIRDQMVKGMMKSFDKDARGGEIILDEIFGRGGWASLKVGDDRGVAAKKALVTALSRAFLEELVDFQMTRQWDQRDGLD